MYVHDVSKYSYSCRAQTIVPIYTRDIVFFGDEPFAEDPAAGRFGTVELDAVRFDVDFLPPPEGLLVLFAGAAGSSSSALSDSSILKLKAQRLAVSRAIVLLYMKFRVRSRMEELECSNESACSEIEVRRVRRAG